MFIFCNIRHFSDPCISPIVCRCPSSGHVCLLGSYNYLMCDTWLLLDPCINPEACMDGARCDNLGDGTVGHVLVKGKMNLVLHAEDRYQKVSKNSTGERLVLV